MQAAKGIWIAAGTTEQDRRSVGPDRSVAVPPGDPSYKLRRIFLTKEQRDSYYYGYCNEGIWPLSHIAYTRPVFCEEDWVSYQKVNRIFADAILEEVGDRKAFVWIQDFHLVLVAKYLREAGRPNLITSLFWHVPWPNPEVFRICPQKKQILEGFLAHDLVGFQIRYHADNFLACVDQEMESRIDREKTAVIYQNRETLVRAFPVSIDFESITAQGQGAAENEPVARIRQEFHLEDKKLLIGVDRIDYTKGIPDRFRAIDRFLDKYPEYKEKIVFYQIGQISRLHVPRYKQLNDELNALVEEINWKHSQGSWAPIVFRRSTLNYQDILGLYCRADCCIVSSLHDGMNLVAKEFVAARSDSDGVLILSCFTGAARELEDALIINPYDIESFADAIRQALEMPPEERTKRMKKMREIVAQQNIFRWAGKVLSQLLKFEFQEE
jgi:trehalose 6-phosphate synthase